MAESASKAVFLSYAREDAAAARRIAEALRAAGVEVWFDESELRGGDSWDANIRQQIKECALFMPIISARTQARAEGYFRLEWRLADRRTELIGKSKAFLVPVCIDDTREAHADVPDSFCAVQWTRLPAGTMPPAFVARIRALAGLDANGPARPVDAGKPSRTESIGNAPRRLSTLLMASAAIAVIAVIAITLAIWRPWNSSAAGNSPSLPRASSSVDRSGEVARLRARLVPDSWKQEDFEPWSGAVDRLIAADGENADAWALRSIINSLHVIRQFDAGTRPLDVGKSAAARALHLAPDSALGELAMGMHHTAMISRGGDVNAARSHLRRASTGLPRDSLTRYAELTSFWLGYQFEDTERAALAWLAAEPTASFPAWILGQMNLSLRNPAGVTKWAEQATGDREITGVRALITLFDAHYYLRGNLAEARATLDRIPMGGRSVHRALHSRWLLAMAERRWDVALQELSRTPETIFYDRTFHGPKALLAGLAHQAAGRSDAALAQFSEAERVLREHLAKDGQNEELHAVLAFTLACGGRRADARGELSLVEPLVRGRPRTVYTGQTITLLAQTHAALGQVGPMVYWLRELLSGPAVLPFTPASLRLDPRFQTVVGTAEVQALLKEFAHLDAKNTAEASGSDAKSIAVLAFDNRSGDPSNEYFSDGISEELINVLGRVPGLTVKGRTSAFYFKGRNASSSEIARELGVSYLVTGSVRKMGDTVRISAQLTRATTDEVLWSSGSLDRPLKDIFAVQDEIAGLIAKSLSLRLSGTSRATKKIDPEAYRFALEGRHHWSTRTTPGLARAEDAYRRAIAIAPDYADAHTGLALVHVIRGNYRLWSGFSEADADFKLTKGSAHEAIRLDPNSAEAFAALGYCYMLGGEIREAAEQFERALAVDPNSALAHYWHGLLLSTQGRIDEALKEYALSRVLNPLDPTYVTVSAQEHCRAGQFQVGLALAQRVASLTDGTFLPLWATVARAHQALGNTVEALRAARYVLDNPEKTPRWSSDVLAVWIIAQTGTLAEAQTRGRALLNRYPDPSYLRGFVLCAMGEFDDALPHLKQVPANHGRIMFYEPLWDPWRDDPRFDKLMADLGRSGEYKAARVTLARLQKEHAAKQ